MSKLTFIFTILLSISAFAGSMFDGMTKEQLADYEITITNKRTGKTVAKMSRAEYKVVKIGSSNEEAPPEAKRLAKVLNENVNVVKKYNKGYNTLILHGGVGKDGLRNTYDSGSGQWEVSERDRAVGGVTGCHSVRSGGICATGLTNRTFLMGFKLDF